jgi:cytochrome b
MSAERYDPATRVLHLLLAALGIAAVISGQFADDYRRLSHSGFDVHKWIGAGMGAALLARLAWGLAGPAAVRFSSWLPWTASRLARAGEDVRGLLRLKLPVHEEGHEGLAGVVQAIGLLAFAWMASMGALLFVWLEPGVRAAGWLRLVKELHEGGQAVVLAYLALHIGAVLANGLAGRALWRRMFF